MNVDASSTSQPCPVSQNDGTSAEHTDASSEKSHDQSAVHCAASGSDALSEQSAAGAECPSVEPDNTSPENDGDTTEADSDRSKAELKVPREHGRLDALLTQIPKKAQHGLLMQCDLILTCIDANEHFIALGTNIGLTFLYNRKDHSIQRLKSETSSDVITCVKLHHGVDHQLAIGMASGTLCIFLIPSFISLHKKQLQKFDVRSVHRHYITCVEWSTNGMKLFSGDKTGHVVLTEVDFYEGECKSSLLLVEPPTEIVQLHYDHRVLLVSTRHRTFVCRLDTTREVVQVGQQDRKIQGTFGAVFIPGLHKVEDARLYAVRPGCRVWLADVHGNVLHTHIFKDPINSSVHDIPLLHPATQSTNPTAELQFGRLHVYGDGQLVTYSTTTLFILDTHRNLVVGSQNRVGGIVDLAIHQDEIFILRRHGDSAVVRVAYNPEALLPTGIPFDLPLSTTTTVSTVSTVTSVDSQSGQKQEENKTKTFFKKTFLSPFKKLDNFIQEHTQPKEAPAPDLRPVIRSDPDHAGNNTTSTFLQSDQHDSSPDLPPVLSLDPNDLPPLVPLTSPDLATRAFPGDKKGSGSPIDVQSPDSAHSALSVFAEEIVSPTSEVTPVVKVTGPEGVAGMSAGEGVQAAGDQDIVFSHQMHKKKGKKKKGKGKALDVESDNISQSSFGSQVSEETKGDHAGGGQSEIDDVLRRAEEALSNVDKLLKEGDNQDRPDQGGSVQSDAVTGTQTDEPKSGTDSVSDDASSLTLVQQSSTTQRILTEHGAREDGQDVTDFTRTARGEHASITCSQQVGDVSLPPLSTPSGQTSTHTGSVETSPRTDTCTGISQGNTTSSHSPQHNASSQSPTHPASCQSPKDTASSSSTPTHPSNHTAQTNAAQDNAANHPEGEDSLVAAERTLDRMTRRYKLSVKTQDSVDDFYSKFSSPYSPTDLFESPTTSIEHHSFADMEKMAAQRQTSETSVGSRSSEKSLQEATQQRLANNWSEFTTPANIYSLALSTSHIWFTDKSENLYYSALGAVKGIVWRKVGEPAGQISVSPSGHIVWRLHRGHVFAGTKITQRRPEGLKWVEAVSNVTHMCVDDHCAWYVKASGEVMMQRGLSKERPCFRSLNVETEEKVKQVMARYGVVWAITDNMRLLVRTGISNDTPQGLAWHLVDRQAEPFMFTSVTLDNEGIGWAIDVVGQIWFTDNVTPQNPVGSGKWWQVPLSEYFIQDHTVLDTLRSMAKKFDAQKLTSILNTRRGGLMAAGDQGIWLSLDYLNTLYVCRSSLQGYYWSLAQPSQMASSTLWKQVNASVAHLDWGLVWAQQVNGELYAIPADSSDAVLTPTPSVFLSYSVNDGSVWGLTSDAELFIRTGMGQHCPHGVDWTCLDMVQLGGVFLVHVTCNNNYVWVVDADGRVFHRIGASAPKPGQLNPVWLPIDVYTEIIFTKVVIGPLDWMVWAVDNRRLTYVRVGVSEDLPIGKEWVHVPGIQAMDVCVSGSGVWALNTNGEILFRYGITASNVSGNYWKKIPGCFTRISAASNDVLWAVNTSGHLVKCSSRHLLRRQDSADPLLQRSVSTASEDGEWELV